MSDQYATLGATRPAAWRRAVLPADFQTDADGSSRTLRDWFVDSGVFSISVAIGALIAHDQREHFLILNASVGLLACVSLWWRRSHPLQVGLIASLASCVSGASGFAWLVALYNSALRLDRKGLAAVIAIGAVGFITYPIMYPPDEGLWTSVALGIGAAGTALGLGTLARARREHVLALVAAGEVAESQQLLREELAREAERHRIAREMHDVLAHRISLLTLHAGALEYRKDAAPEEVAAAAGVIRASAQDALQELRDVIGVMRTRADEDKGPPQPELSDIPAMVQQFRDAGVRVDFEPGEALDADLSASTGRTLHRVVQEGLTNASKHAPGAKVSVTLSMLDADRVGVLVENDLSVGSRLGAVSLSEPGVGLVGLGERVVLAGGSLEYGESNAKSFRLAADLPRADG